MSHDQLDPHELTMTSWINMSTLGLSSGVVPLAFRSEATLIIRKSLKTRISLTVLLKRAPEREGVRPEAVLNRPERVGRLSEVGVVSECRDDIGVEVVCGVRGVEGVEGVRRGVVWCGVVWRRVVVCGVECGVVLDNVCWGVLCCVVQLRGM